MSETLRLMIFSVLIACPIAWWFLNSWLKNFAYKTNLDIWIFIGSGLAALLIALISIGYQALKAATKNPAEVLKYE
jgi:putative ABC transport system permease protein